MNDATTLPAEPVAILAPDEAERYREAVLVLAEQREVVKRAKVELDRAVYLARCVDGGRETIWQELCEACSLDSNGLYEVDGAGRVFAK